MTSTSRSTRRRDLVLLAIAVVVAAVLVGALVLGTTGDGEQSEAAPGRRVEQRERPAGDGTARRSGAPRAR